MKSHPHAIRIEIQMVQTQFWPQGSRFLEIKTPTCPFYLLPRVLMSDPYIQCLDPGPRFVSAYLSPHARQRGEQGMMEGKKE